MLVPPSRLAVGGLKLTTDARRSETQGEWSAGRDGALAAYVQTSAPGRDHRLGVSVQTGCASYRGTVEAKALGDAAGADRESVVARPPRAQPLSRARRRAAALARRRRRRARQRRDRDPRRRPPRSQAPLLRLAARDRGQRERRDAAALPGARRPRRVTGVSHRPASLRAHAADPPAGRAGDRQPDRAPRARGRDGGAHRRAPAPLRARRRGAGAAGRGAGAIDGARAEGAASRSTASSCASRRRSAHPAR